MPFRPVAPATPGGIIYRPEVVGQATGTPFTLDYVDLPAGFFTLAMQIEATVSAGAVSGWSLSIDSPSVVARPRNPAWPQAGLGTQALYENTTGAALRAVPILMSVTSTAPAVINGPVSLLVWPLNDGLD